MHATDTPFVTLLYCMVCVVFSCNTAYAHLTVCTQFPPMQQPSSRSRQCLFTANGGSGRTGGTMAFVDSKLDVALDYSWSLPVGKGAVKLYMYLYIIAEGEK